MTKLTFVLTITLGALSYSAQGADTPSGLSFWHEDWELACDNTRTCRAAGYQADNDELAVSVLLSRKAGPGEPVTGELMIGQYGENEALTRLPARFKVTMRVNGHAVGRLAIEQNRLVAKLSEKQVAALLAAMHREADIEWVAEDVVWRLSDKGAAAVLLKMDDFQGRVGTQGAAFKKGSRDESRVLPALTVPVVTAAALAKPRADDDRFLKRNPKMLRDALMAGVKGDECYALMEDGDEPAELSAVRLSETKMLVSGECWRGAYNVGIGYWVVDDAPPYRAVLVTTGGSGFSDSSITATQKGRGLGDCWSSDAWIWDGTKFVHSESSTTGMCKLLAPGGGWSLPTIVTEERPATR